MAAPSAVAVLVALSTMTSAAAPIGRVDSNLELPKLTLHAPATVPAAASPRLDRNALGRQPPVEDVDVTGPVR